MYRYTLPARAGGERVSVHGTSPQSGMTLRRNDRRGGVLRRGQGNLIDRGADGPVRLQNPGRYTFGVSGVWLIGR
jgi:hypothetical protein